MPMSTSLTRCSAATLEIGNHSALSVEPLLAEPSEGYAREYAARLRLGRVVRDIGALKSRLQRTNPVEEQASYNRMFAQLLELETRRRSLEALAIGGA